MDTREEESTPDGSHAAVSGQRNKKGPDDFRVVDKRHFLDLDKLPMDGPVEEKPRYPTFVEELLARVTATERRFEERKRQIDEEIRRSKERLESDFQRNLQIEKQKLILPFLDVLDNLQRAVSAAHAGNSAASLLAGVEMIADQFSSCLQAQGVEALAVTDQPYDPNLGQAVGVVPVGDASLDGVVVEEVLRGYRIGDQLLRPAQVRVGRFRQG